MGQAERVLELWSIFIKAALQAKANNKYEPKLEVDRKTVTEWMKKAFPSVKDESVIASLVDDCMKSYEKAD